MDVTSESHSENGFYNPNYYKITDGNLKFIKPYLLAVLYLMNLMVLILHKFAKQ